MRGKISTFSVLVLAFGISGLTTGCGGGGGGGGGGPAAPGGGSTAVAADPSPATFKTPGTMPDAPVIALEELESNNNSGIANTVMIGQSITGDLGDMNDVDWFQFEATTGDILSIELRAHGFDQGTWGVPLTQVDMTLFSPGGQQRRYNVPQNGSDQDFPLLDIRDDGMHTLRLRPENSNGGGLYALSIKRRTLPGLQREMEPIQQEGDNDSRFDAEPIVPGTMVGYYLNNDDDFYEFEITEPSIVFAEITSFRNGRFDANSANYDPVLRLRDSTGVLIDSNDDTNGFDSALQAYLLPGTYYWNVDEFSGSNGSDVYFLTFEVESAAAQLTAADNTSSDMAAPLSMGQIASGELANGRDHWFRLDVIEGDALQFFVFDANEIPGENVTAEISFFESDATNEQSYDRDNAGARGLDVATLIAQETGSLLVRVRQETPTNDTGLFSIMPKIFLRGPTEVEPNAQTTEATPFGSGRAVHGRVFDENDFDTYSFSAQEGQLLNFVLHGGEESFVGRAFDGYGSGLVGAIEILDTDGSVITLSQSIINPSPERNSSKTGGAEVSFVAPSAGTYFVRVYSIGDPSFLPGSYLLERNP